MNVLLKHPLKYNAQIKEASQLRKKNFSLNIAFQKRKPLYREKKIGQSQLFLLTVELVFFMLYKQPEMHFSSAIALIKLRHCAPELTGFWSVF